VLYQARQKYANRLLPEMQNGRFFQGLGLAGGTSITLTLLLTAIGWQTFGVLLNITGFTPSENAVFNHTEPVQQARQQYAQSEPAERAKHATGASHWLGHSVHIIHILHASESVIKTIEHNKTAGVVAIIIFVVLIVLLSIGAGYAFTGMELPFLFHAIAYSTGVGLPEEFTKAVAGCVILYNVLPQNTDNPTTQPRVLLAFGLAGLGFGAVEALKYFGIYAMTDQELAIYFVRALWCVPLHAAWTVIAGSFFIRHCPASGAEFLKNLWPNLGKLLLACIPAILLHGVYDAMCVHNIAFCWVVGAASIFWAYRLVQAELPPQPATATATA
jgi:hypothetical protein